MLSISSSVALLALFAQFAAVSHASAAASATDAASLAEEWCEYTRHTPEPKVLIYNRIPKAGSETMAAIIKRQAAQNWKINFVGVKLKHLPVTEAEKLEILNDITHSRQSQFTSVAGHIPFFSNRLSSVPGGVEFMNVLRSCAERRTSSLYYDLFDSNSASQAQKDKVLLAYQQAHLRSTDPTACMANATCLTRSPMFRLIANSSVIGHFMGGDDCVGTMCLGFNDTVAAVRKHLQPHLGNYITVGPLEYLTEYLEMLECVYPTYFHDSARLFRSSPLHINHGSKTEADHLKPGITALFQQTCVGAIDAVLYKELVDQFKQRYNLMVSKKGHCCRAK